MNEDRFSAHSALVTKGTASKYRVRFVLCAPWGKQLYIDYGTDELTEEDIRIILVSEAYRLRERLVAHVYAPKNLPKNIMPLLEPAIQDIAKAIVDKGEY